MRTCGPCSLKTGSYLVSVYTFILGILLLGFNIWGWTYAPQYMAWSRIVAVIFGVSLIIAAIFLFMGLNRNSGSLISAWFMIFLIYVVVQIAAVIWRIIDYAMYYDGIPPEIVRTYLADIIIFAILILVNIWSLMAVKSYRNGSGASMNVVV